MDPPHPPLPTYYDGEQARSGWVRDIFSRTAADYDRVERAISFGSGSWYRHRALRQAGPGAGMVVVDVGVGTGLVARQAAAIAGDPACVIGVDPSPGMVANAKVPGGVRLMPGSAEHLPVPAASAEFISMGFALRRVVPWIAACVSLHQDTPKLMGYYWDTIEACVAAAAVMSAMRVAGFVRVVRNVELGIFSAYGAQKPAG